MQTFYCGKCHQWLTADCFYFRNSGKRITQCKPCYSETNRDSKYRYNFGLSLDEYNAMLISQNSGCAICGTNEPGGKGAFHVDHDHACCPGKRSCGKCVRGLLCTTCNIGIAMFNDDPSLMAEAIRYVKLY